MNFTKYLAHFKSIFGIVAVISGSLPFLAIVPPTADLTSFFFPPLGDHMMKAQILTFAGVLLTVVLVYFLAPADCLRGRQSKSKLLSYLSISAIFSIILYLGLSQLFVLKMEIPSESKIIYVSTGFSYTEDLINAKTEFDTRYGPNGTAMLDLSDEEKIRERGISDEELKWIWTPVSLHIIRFSLWLTYFMFVLTVVAIFSFAVYFDLTQSLQIEI